MRAIQAWLLTLSLIALGLAAAGHAAQVEDPAKQIERSIEEARTRLDAAARRLAELHTQLWELETSGPRAQRPMLGILVKDAGSAAGLTLGGVTPEGGAERAGLQAGDIIVEVNGVRLDGGDRAKPLHSLSEAMAPVAAGDTVAVRYLRDGEVFSTEVETQARGSYVASMVVEKGPWLESLRSLGDLEPLEALEGLAELEVLEGLEPPELGDHILHAPAGLRLQRVEGELAGYFDVDEGVVVLAAPAREPALKAGDVLLSLDGDPVTEPVAALRHLAAATGTVDAQVKRRGRELDLELDAGALNAQRSVHVLHADRQISIQRDDDGGLLRLEIRVDD